MRVKNVTSVSVLLLFVVLTLSKCTEQPIKFVKSILSKMFKKNLKTFELFQKV